MARLYMQGLRRVPNIFDYGSHASLMPKYASICLMFLNTPEHGGILLNVPEEA